MTITKLDYANSLAKEIERLEKELEDIEALKTYYTKFYCSNCKDELFLYTENYKCISCKNKQFKNLLG